jgi:hypothetical protein
VARVLLAGRPALPPGSEDRGMAGALANVMILQAVTATDRQQSLETP